MSRHNFVIRNPRAIWGVNKANGDPDQGAREHNLKNIDVTIPKHGSGRSSPGFPGRQIHRFDAFTRKDSAATSSFDYARQFLGRLDKPDVDSIDGIPPAIAIEQHVLRGSALHGGYPDRDPRSLAPAVRTHRHHHLHQRRAGQKGPTGRRIGPIASARGQHSLPRRRPHPQESRPHLGPAVKNFAAARTSRVMDAQAKPCHRRCHRFGCRCVAVVDRLVTCS